MSLSCLKPSMASRTLRTKSKVQGLQGALDLLTLPFPLPLLYLPHSAFSLLSQAMPGPYNTASVFAAVTDAQDICLGLLGPSLE